MAEPAFDEAYYRENSQDGDRAALWFYERVARRLAPAGSRAIDYGCGTGYFARRLARHFATSGYDVSPDARRLTRDHAPGVTVFDAAGDIPERSFALVTALHVLEHVPDPAAPLAMFSRWLAPSGALLMVVPNPQGWGHRMKGEDWFAYRDPTHCSLLSMDAWLAAVRESGLTIERAATDGLWDPPYVRRVPRLLQRPAFGAMAAVQVAAGRLFLPRTWGECLVLVARR